MPRKPIERSSEHFYHITARSNNKEFFYLPTEQVWQIMTLRLKGLQKQYNIKISAFVLMNNHFHLLVLTPVESIDRIMYFFMKDLTLEIQKHSGRINKVFGGRYRGSMIKNGSYLLNVYKYIYRNPVVAGLSKIAEDYPYSTLFYEYQPNAIRPFQLEKVGHQFLMNELEWINQGFESAESQSIKTGLKKTVFQYGIDRKTREPIVPSFHSA